MTLVLQPWLTEVVACLRCGGRLRETGDDFLKCSSCESEYPVRNSVPLLMSSDAFEDRAEVLGNYLGGVSARAVEIALASATRYRLRDHTLSGEFSNIVERYGSVFSQGVAESSQPEAGIGREVECVAEYLNPRFKRGEETHRSIRIKNNSTDVWSSDDGRPYHLSYWLTSGSGRREEGVRTRLPVPIHPGRELTVPLKLKVPSVAGKYRLDVMLVQEFVKWYEPATFSTDISVEDGDICFGPDLHSPPHQGFFDFDEDCRRCGQLLEDAVRLQRSAGKTSAIRVLEVACGADPLSLRFYLPETQVVCSDLAFPQLQLAALRHASHPGVREGGVAFAAADFANSPFLPGAFDVVVIFAALHHFRDLVQALVAMKKLLAPGGVIIVGREPGKIAAEDATYIKELLDGFNEQQFVVPEYETIFERAGLQVRDHRLDFECSYKAMLAPA